MILKIICSMWLLIYTLLLWYIYGGRGKLCNIGNVFITIMNLLCIFKILGVL